jgi:DNA-binding MarR family transcriptional regulator
MAKRLPWAEWRRLMQKRLYEGRRRINRERQEAARKRRDRIRAILAKSRRDPCERGTGVWLARQLGVTPSTVCRDLQALGLSRPRG